jgi:predicted dehydrogenase
MTETTRGSTAFRVTRRTFLRKAARGAVIATFAIAGTEASGRVLGSNDAIRVGIAGIHGRGGSHIDEFKGMEGVRVTYLIDPDASLFESRAKKAGGKPIRCVQDVRAALDDKDLDVISIATCNHWHSLMTIWACQAGKHVYVEKPLSHNVYEGRKAVEAARKYNRAVQHGTQQRSSGGRAREIAAVQSGHYGKLLVSKGYCAKPRWSIDFKKPEPPPSHLDFNLWLGPAPQQEFHRNLVHYNWHWFWDTGNGDIGNQGVHEMDIARWAIPGATLPRRVVSLGGRFGYADQGETPNTQMAVFEFDEALLVFEVRGLVGGKSKDRPRVGNEYYTTEGRIADGRFYPKSGGEPEKLEDFGEGGRSVRPRGNFGNFIDCVRSGKTADLNADVLEGHYSSALCHLANISYRLGTEVPFDSKSKRLGDDRVVLDTFKALEENLTKGVGLKLEGLKYRLGRTLEFDAASERFDGDQEANRLLSRAYREPFVVPANV